MKRYLILLLLVSFCGGSSETTAVDDSATTSSSSTSTSTSTTSSSNTTLPPTTTTTTTLPPTTTTTTIPIPQKTIIVLEININNPITKLKDVRDAIACGIDKNHVNSNILQNAVTSYNSLIPPDFAVDGLDTAYTDINCSSKNYSENFVSATNILKRQFTATSWFDGIRCTNETACRIENLKLRDSSVSPNFNEAQGVSVTGCGPGSDPIMNTHSLFIADYISRLGIKATSRPWGCKSTSYEYVKSSEYANIIKDTNGICELASNPFRISKITINNLYDYFSSLTEKQTDVCYEFFYTNFSNQVIKDNLVILKEDNNNIEAARSIERELLSNNVIIPLYIISDVSFERYKDEKAALEEELNNIDSDSDRAYDINNRIVELDALLLGSEESLTFFHFSPSK